jgi:hypothetical protein
LKETRAEKIGGEIGGSLATALKAIENSRQALERLIDQTDIDEEHTLGRIPSILSELRAAQSTLEQLSHEHTA